MEDEELSNSFQIESLPELVICIVAKYLSTRDLAVCCATSYKMRELFNKDIIWTPRCNKPIAEYLMNTPCKVKPGFQNPESENSTLPRICDCRIAFMAENHLWNNWRLGNYTEEAIIPQGSESVVDYHRFISFYSNDIVITQLNDRIELLDVREYPAVPVTEPIRLTARTRVNSCYDLVVADDMLLMVCDSSVRVYYLDFSIQKNTLKHMFVVKRKEKVPQNKLGINLKFIGINDMIYVITGSFFVGMFRYESTMHIWNFKTGVKVKEEVCPCKDEDITFSSMQVSGSTIVLAFRNKDHVTFLLAYNLSELKYFPFIIKFNKEQFVFKYFTLDNVVAVWTKDQTSWSLGGCITVYNYQSNQQLYTHTLPPASHPEIMSKRVLFVEQGIAQSSNLISLDILSGKSRTLIKGIHSFEVLSDKFIKVFQKAKEDGIQNKLSEVCENSIVKEVETDLIDFSSELKSKHYPYHSGSFFNKALSRSFNEKRNRLLNFW